MNSTNTSLRLQPKMILHCSLRQYCRGVIFYIFKSSGRKSLFPILAAIVPWLLFPITLLLIKNTTWGTVGLHAYIVLVFFLVVNGLQSKWLLVSCLSMVAVYFYPWEFSTEQKQFFDPVHASLETRKGIGRVVQWKGDYWHYYNNQLQYSTIDGHIWTEAYAQPAMHLLPEDAKVLLIGGESRLLIPELGKYFNDISILPYDLEFHQKFESYTVPYFDVPIPDFLLNNEDTFDLIILDLPDPINVEFAQFYSEAFYALCYQSLGPNGLMVSHSGDLFARNMGVKKIWKNAENSEFAVTTYHAQIPTLGHWTWFIGAKTREGIREKLSEASPKGETKWWNQEAMDMMLNFGEFELLESR